MGNAVCGDRPVMRILQLFVKVQADAPLVACDRLTLVAPEGIVGDRHRQVGSPRQVLLLDQATLDRVGLAPGVLRENVLCGVLPPGLASGRSLELGSAQIRLTFLCEPCRYLNEIQPGLAQRLKDQRGWLGMVTQGGQIQVGDRGILGDRCYPPLPAAARDRFEEFVARIPPGAVVTTADLVLALGVTAAHYRVFPAWMKAVQAQLPVHRIVSKGGEVFAQHLPQQAALLQAEGVTVQNGRVGQGDRWPPEAFHPLVPLCSGVAPCP